MIAAIGTTGRVADKTLKLAERVLDMAHLALDVVEEEQLEALEVARASRLKAQAPVSAKKSTKRSMS